MEVSGVSEWGTGRRIVLLLVLALGLMAGGTRAHAGDDIEFDPTFDQSDFENLVEDLGVGLSYTPLDTPEAEGIGGFDLGVGVSAVDLKQNKDYTEKAFDGDAPSYLYLPKLQAELGLLPSLGVSGFFTGDPRGNARLWGGAVKWTLIHGGITFPTMAVRGHGSRLQGVGDLDLDTVGWDVSVSKGFANLTPYAGYSGVSIDGEYTGGDPLLQARLDDVDEDTGRVFAGLRVSLGPMNLVAEADFGEIEVYSARLNVGF